MTNIIKKILKHKNKGISDFIASLFVIVALTIFALFFIGTIKDIETRIQIDQIARKYILRMESSGQLTSNEIDAIKKELNNINSVRLATGGTGDSIIVDSNSKTGSEVGYGQPIYLTIKCPAVRTVWNIKGKSTWGVVKRDGSSVTTLETDANGNLVEKAQDGIITYAVTKQSTAKY